MLDTTISDMKKGPTMTDREMIAAVYKAVEQLYERVVGERLLVTIPTEDGKSTLSIMSLGLDIPDRLKQ
jgi:replicative superfamily II helicase